MKLTGFTVRHFKLEIVLARKRMSSAASSVHRKNDTIIVEALIKAVETILQSRVQSLGATRTMGIKHRVRFNCAHSLLRCVSYVVSAFARVRGLECAVQFQSAADRRHPRRHGVVAARRGASTHAGVALGDGAQRGRSCGSVDGDVYSDGGAAVIGRVCAFARDVQASDAFHARLVHDLACASCDTGAQR